MEEVRFTKDGLGLWIFVFCAWTIPRFRNRPLAKRPINHVTFFFKKWNEFEFQFDLVESVQLKVRADLKFKMLL